MTHNKGERGMKNGERQFSTTTLPIKQPALLDISIFSRMSVPNRIYEIPPYIRVACND